MGSLMIAREFYSTMIYSALKWWDTTKLPALVALKEKAIDELCGIAVYRPDGREWS